MPKLLHQSERLQFWQDADDLFVTSLCCGGRIRWDPDDLTSVKQIPFCDECGLRVMNERGTAIITELKVYTPVDIIEYWVQRWCEYEMGTVHVEVRI